MDFRRSYGGEVSKIQTVYGNDDVIQRKRNLSIKAKTQNKKVKGKVQPRTGHEGPEGEQRYSFTFSLTSALDGMGCQRHTPAVLPPAKKTGTHFTVDWLRPKAGLDGCGKSRPPTGFDSQTVQPVESLYRVRFPAHE